MCLAAHLHAKHMACLFWEVGHALAALPAYCAPTAAYCAPTAAMCGAFALQPTCADIVPKPAAFSHRWQFFGCVWRCWCDHRRQGTCCKTCRTRCARDKLPSRSGTRRFASGQCLFPYVGSGELLELLVNCARRHVVRAQPGEIIVTYNTPDQAPPAGLVAQKALDGEGKVALYTVADGKSDVDAMVQALQKRPGASLGTRECGRVVLGG